MTVAILFLALILRLILFNQSLWLDESIQALALTGRFGPILEYSLTDFQPPLYHFLLKSWTTLFGYSEISLRTPSLLAGVFLVYFVIKLTTLLFSKKTGFLAGLLAATNPLLIYYSQEGRTYIFTTLFVTASFYYLSSYLRKASRSHLIFYSLFTILSLWTSYLAWFAILSQAIFLIIKKNYRVLLVCFLSSLTFIFWLPFLLRSLTFGLTDVGSLPNWGKVVGGISPKAIALTWVKTNLGRISFASKYLYGAIVSVLAVLHLLILQKLRPLTPKTQPIILWLITPVILASLVSLFIPVYSYTRILFIVPAYLILLSFGLSKLNRNYTSLVITSQIIFLTVFWLTPRFHREDWRSLVNDLNSQANIIVAIPSAKTSAPLEYYGLTKLAVELPSVNLNSNQPVYYIRYAEAIFDPALTGRANLESSGYTITGEETYPGIAVDIYEKN